MIEVKKEQEYLLSIIQQMKEIHLGNKTVVTTLEFLEDCIINRMNEG